MSGRISQRHEHFVAAPFALPHVVLHGRVATGELVLVAKPLEHPLRRVPLFATDLPVAAQPTIDDPPRWLIPLAQASRTFRYKSIVKILPPFRSPESVKVANFHAARSRLIPPLSWPTFTPPFGRDAVEATDHYHADQKFGCD